jgi:hypothetical protein
MVQDCLLVERDVAAHDIEICRIKTTLQNLRRIIFHTNHSKVVDVELLSMVHLDFDAGGIAGRACRQPRSTGSLRRAGDSGDRSLSAFCPPSRGLAPG